MSVEALENIGDGCGGYQEIWIARFDVWVRLIPIEGIKVSRADTLENQQTHWVYLRKRSDILPGMRFVANSRKFTIETARDPDETGRYTFCEVREIS